MQAMVGSGVGPVVGSVVGSMAVFALVGAITPGPVNVLAVRHGLALRARVPVAFVLGASLSYALVVALMGLGASQLLHQPAVVQAAQWAGAAWLLWLAWRIATAPVQAMPGAVGTRTLPGAWAAFGEGFALQALNPKAWLVALSGVGLFVLTQSERGSALAAFCIVSLLACAVGVGSWAIGGRLLADWLAPPARQRLFHRVLGAALALSVVAMLR